MLWHYVEDTRCHPGLIRLNTFATKWHDLGLQLEGLHLRLPEFKPDNAIKADTEKDVESSCKKILEAWISRDIGTSWEELLKALRLSENTNLNELTKKLLGELFIITSNMSLHCPNLKGAMRCL